MRSIIYKSLVFAVSAMIASCGNEEPSSQCAGPLCPFVGEWRLDRLEVDGDDYGGDLNYELSLQEPGDDPLSSEFFRNFSDGTSENGTWTVVEDQDVLILNGMNEEQYMIEASGPDFLVLVLHRQDPKPGPWELKYFFVK